jgi:CMP-2-keto-3-deoxyoctulosonic acid synthetase
VIHQDYGAARRCMAAECPVIMLRDQHLEGAARGAGIVRAVGAAREIEVGAQADSPASCADNVRTTMVRPSTTLRLRTTGLGIDGWAKLPFTSP